MRVVLDTNVILSACMKPEGLEARTVGLGISGAVDVCVTAAIEAEYRDVLFRPKFAAFHEYAETLLSEVLARASMLTADCRVTAAADEDDNRFLECAQACGAEFLVTGNLRHYPAEWLGTCIGNARSFLDFIASQDEIVQTSGDRGNR